MHLSDRHKAAIERNKSELAAQAEAEATAIAQQERQRLLAEYPARREADIARALARRISAGDIGLPFLLIDTIFATAVTGDERGHHTDLNGAMEEAKDRLWAQCRHLGGDAVLFADFRLQHGLVSFTNKAAVSWNVVASLVNSVSRTGMPVVEQQDRQATITVFAQGSAVKLFPTGTTLGPQVYDSFDQRWLDLRLPPGLEPGK